MTNEEAVEKLKILKEDYWDDDGYGHESKLYDDTVVALDMAIKALSEERKTGKWVHGREIWREHIGDAIVGIGYEDWRCSECNTLVKDNASGILWKYCPWCGAKMEGSEKG